MVALTASTDSIRVTNGSSIAGFSFGEAGFADGYSTLVYSNTQALSNAESALGTFFGLLADTQTITEAESALATLFADLPESITITEAESAIGLFYGLLAESSTIIDYQFGRGWIKVNDDQNPNWVQIDDSQ